MLSVLVSRHKFSFTVRMSLARVSIHECIYNAIHDCTHCTCPLSLRLDCTIIAHPTAAPTGHDPGSRQAGPQQHARSGPPTTNIMCVCVHPSFHPSIHHSILLIKV